MTRQREWQIKSHKNGLCITCGQKKFTKQQRCEKCKKKAMVVTRKWFKKNPDYVKKLNDDFRKRNPNYMRDYYRKNIRGKKK